MERYYKLPIVQTANACESASTAVHAAGSKMTRLVNYWTSILFTELTGTGLKNDPPFSFAYPSPIFTAASKLGLERCIAMQLSYISRTIKRAVNYTRVHRLYRLRR